MRADLEVVRYGDGNLFHSEPDRRFKNARLTEGAEVPTSNNPGGRGWIRAERGRTPGDDQLQYRR